jgi:catechol 2,3-dioxygenase-like lactoylglutathione lyase family enzyme
MEAREPVRTDGLNHVNLLVADVERAVTFYERALGMQRTGEADGITFLSTPGTADLLALQKAGGDLDILSGKQRTAGDSGGVDHIGFAVSDDARLDRIVEAVAECGGEILFRTTGAEGSAVAFVTDLDGYVLQLG